MSKINRLIHIFLKMKDKNTDNNLGIFLSNGNMSELSISQLSCLCKPEI
jgi:hypothetical protein